MKNPSLSAIFSTSILCGFFALFPHLACATVPIIDSVDPATYLSTSGGATVTATGSGFAVPMSMSFTQMVGGGGYTCAIGADDHKAYCWGSNFYGQLGNGSFSPSPVPIAVDTSGVLAGKTIKHISTGYYQTCVVASDDRAYCWGSNDSGQLGNHSASLFSAVPVAVDASGVLSGKSIVQIEAGAYHTCAIASDGRVYCWGANNFRQLGNGSADDSPIPVAVDASGVLAGKTIKQVATRGYHTCAIASDDQAYCWGSGSSGKLGNGSTITSSVPVAVDTTGMLAGKTIRQISANYSHTCAIASDGQAYCWGYAASGQLGNVSVAFSNTCSGAPCSVTPVAVDTSGVLVGKTIRQIAAENYHTCAVASDDRVYCWGNNGSGQLGNGSNTGPEICVYDDPCSPVPVAVDTSGVLHGKGIQKVARGGDNTCVIDSDGQAYCWGNNYYGQLGNGFRTDRFLPVTVIGWLRPVVTIADTFATHVVLWSPTTLTFTAPARAAGTYSLTIDNGAETALLPNALTYGSAASLTIATANPSDNLAGQETITVRGSGFLRQRATSFTQVSAGYDHTCAIDSTDRQAYCWGNNNQGQLGNGSFARDPAAVDTSGALNGKTIRQIAAGWSHTCAIASDSRAYCWGGNSSGQLGNGSSTSSSVPVAVNTSGALAGKTLLQIGVGYDHSCAIASDGRAYCWGGNSRGQLGNNPSSSSPVPVAVDTSGALAGLTLQHIAVAGRHTCAIASNSRVYCWGENLTGQLGNGIYGPAYFPAAVDTSGVLAGKAIRQIATASDHTCAISTDNRAYCWGDNQAGELGSGSYSLPYFGSMVPLAVDMSGALAGKAIQQITTGAFHSCAIASDGNEYCWGAYTGQLGPADDYPFAVAVDTSGALTGKSIRQTSAGADYTCAIASDDQIYCWGNNYAGQLGNNTSISPSPCNDCYASVPVAVVNGMLPTVTVGGVPATDVAVINDTTLTFIAPWMVNGTYDLSIDYGSETTSLPDALTYFVVDHIFDNGFEQP